MILLVKFQSIAMMQKICPNPKKPPIRLNKKAYIELCKKLYEKQMGICLGCGRWFPPEQFSFHHVSTGGIGMKGDDTLENGEGYCLRCHPD